MTPGQLKRNVLIRTILLHALFWIFIVTLPFLHVGGIALSIMMFMHWFQQKQQTLEAERRQAEAELQLLKAQLHPHFLFNTLNNLNAH